MDAALFNVNDEDWYLWVPIYGIPGFLATVLVFKPQAVSESGLWKKLSVMTLAFCLSYLLYQVVLLFQVIRGQIQNPLQHEEGREMAGLLIIITWLILFRFTNIGRQDVSPTNKNLMNVLLLLAGTLACVPIITWSLCFVADWHTKLGHCTGMF
ncbi:transmembrane protein 220-like isoform X2 [Gigantopelta aegis]|uniref:transmembrane protein 220-like isoform X2 n=1 Tax=Gigantopelta aegis TaxID=1735272 RepID=UPI001B889263|nr:transmembrane protein 220-like isoform X2 [Gigantopelta aegis]